MNQVLDRVTTKGWTFGVRIQKLEMSDVTRRQVISAIRVTQQKHCGPITHRSQDLGRDSRVDNLVVNSVLSEYCLWCECMNFFVVLRTSLTLRGGWFVIPTSCAHSCDVWHDILEVAGEFRVWGSCLLWIAFCLRRFGTTMRVLTPWVGRQREHPWVMDDVLVTMMCFP